MTKQRHRLSELRSVPALSDKPIDLLITSASFELRSLSIPTGLDKGLVRRTVVGVNVTYLESVNEHFRKISEHFDGKVTKLELDADDPVVSAFNIAQVLEQHPQGSPERVLVDITAFTREGLLMVLDYVDKRRRPKDEVLLGYATAADYSIGNSIEDKWLSKGVRDVRSVLGFPGRMIPSRATHLIVMVGFENERALELVEICEPTFVSLGVADVGEESAQPHQETLLRKTARLRDGLRGRVIGLETFTFRAYDAEATEKVLRHQASVFGPCNVVVVPMNTKISTVGAMLLARREEAVQICYAPANVYNTERYSVPGSYCYLFRLGSEEEGLEAEA